jgi:hypothetical protein
VAGFPFKTLVANYATDLCTGAKNPRKYAFVYKLIFGMVTELKRNFVI